MIKGSWSQDERAVLATSVLLKWVNGSRGRLASAPEGTQQETLGAGKLHLLPWLQSVTSWVLPLEKRTVGKDSGFPLLCKKIIRSVNCGGRQWGIDV